MAGCATLEVLARSATFKTDNGHVLPWELGAGNDPTEGIGEYLRWRRSMDDGYEVRGKGSQTPQAIQTGGRGGGGRRRVLAKLTLHPHGPCALRIPFDRYSWPSLPCSLSATSSTPSPPFP
jgi:hypothetical protein